MKKFPKTVKVWGSIASGSIMISHGNTTTLATRGNDGTWEMSVAVGRKLSTLRFKSDAELRAYLARAYGNRAWP